MDTNHPVQIWDGGSDTNLQEECADSKKKQFFLQYYYCAADRFFRTGPATRKLLLDSPSPWELQLDIDLCLRLVMAPFPIRDPKVPSSIAQTSWLPARAQVKVSTAANLAPGLSR